LSYLLSYPDDDGDRDNSSFFADDNPLSHVTAKLEMGGERRYEFSGPLGDKIKESLNAAPADQDRDRERDRDSVSVSPLSTHLTPAADPIPERQQVAVAAKMVPKVNILKVPRRSIGSVTSLSLDDQTLHSYAKDDYANYAIGDILQHYGDCYID
jgi:hypothetical protein